MTALDELTAALSAALEAGTPPPCAGRDEWVSDRPSKRRRAAAACAGCPTFTECGAAAEHLAITFGVWAGRDRGERDHP